MLESVPQTIMDSAPVNLYNDDNLSAELSGARAAIETRLQNIVPSEQTWPMQLHAAQRHALLSPGKRFRPLLCVFIAQGAGFEGDAAKDLGCVAEMVHAASLILDDLPCMDDAALRRNQPTTHIAFDESTAILTATSLLNRAFSVLAKLPNIDASCRIELVELLSYSVGSKGLIAGQFADLSNTDNSASIAEIERLNALKTSALFEFSVEGAAILARVSGSTRAALKDFSHQLGLAFQLMDDVKDKVMNESQAKKSVGRDTGKATILALTGSEASMERLKGYIASAKDSLGRAQLSNAATLNAVIDTQFSFLK